MKTRPSIVILAIAGAFSVATGAALSMYQTRRDSLPKIKEIKVTARNLAELPNAEKYVVDLTRKGTIYTFDPAGGWIDFQRVNVRTAHGEQSLSVWLEKTFSKNVVLPGDSGSLRIGRYGHLSGNTNGTDPRPTPTPTPTQGKGAFQCDWQYCTCNGASDCDNMVVSLVCGGFFACTRRGGSVRCICGRDWTE